MRIVRFTQNDDSPTYGILRDQTIHHISGDIFGEWQETGEQSSLGNVSLLAPVNPPNILAIGKNYTEHAAETDSPPPPAPILFIKATTSLNHPEADIVLPKMAPDEVDYEAELVIVIGKEARKVSEDDVDDYVLGYTCGNDISARDAQIRLDAQWARGKSFDTFACLGPWIETEIDPDNVAIRSYLNGELMQDSHTSLLIFNTRYLVSYLSHNLTLLPGTLIMTGTPLRGWLRSKTARVFAPR